MEIFEHKAYARAGLIGNPSDGYQGKTISFTLRNYWARVVLYPWDRLEILWSETDKNRFESIDEMINSVKLNGYYGGVRLIKATIKRFVEYCRLKEWALDRGPFSIQYETNIPRGVGMSGSSAIVVATLRCLQEYYGVEIDLATQASLARSVEFDELGIVCGYQDRVIQVYEGLVYMDFGGMNEVDGLLRGEYERIEPKELPLIYVAFDTGASKTSGSVHGPLRSRVEEDERLRTIMAEIASLVPLARQALLAGDHAGLHRLLDQNFDLRQQLYTIRPSHLAMVEAARSVGASAKFAGSGGAIVGTCPDEDGFEQMQDLFDREHNAWCLIRPDLGLPNADRDA